MNPYIFKNPLRAAALPWMTEFKPIIEAHPLNTFIMSYFNSFDAKGNVAPAVKKAVYNHLKKELPSKGYIVFRYHASSPDITIRKDLANFAVGVSHEIPDKEIKELVNHLVACGCEPDNYGYFNK
jgi:hypothetical protein